MTNVKDLILLSDYGINGASAPLIPKGQLGIYFRNNSFYMRTSDGGEVAIELGPNPYAYLPLSGGTLTGPLGVFASYQSAALSVNSTTQGFLMPRMSLAQVQSMMWSDQGLLAYSLDDNSIYSLNGAPTTASADDGNASYVATVPGPDGNNIEIVINTPFNGTLSISVVGTVVTFNLVRSTGHTKYSDIQSLYNSSPAAQALFTLNIYGDPTRIAFNNDFFLGGGGTQWLPANWSKFLSLDGSNSPMTGAIDMGNNAINNVGGINCNINGQNWFNRGGAIIANAVEGFANAGFNGTTPNVGLNVGDGAWTLRHCDLITVGNTDSTNLVTMTSIDFSGGNQCVSYMEFYVVVKTFNNVSTAAFAATFKIAATVGFGPAIGNGAIFHQEPVYTYAADPSLSITLYTTGTISGGDWQLKLDLNHPNANQSWYANTKVAMYSTDS